MLLTKENDYAIRMIRAIKDGEKHTMKEICLEEEIPEAFAYKIVRKLQNAGIVSVERGAAGGCKINDNFLKLSLFDVIDAIDDTTVITQCIKKPCTRNTKDNPCKVHHELMAIQEVLIDELKKRKLRDIL